MSAGFINIHTHHSDPSADICLHNFIFGIDEVVPLGYFSAGAHPWYLNSASENELENFLKQQSVKNQFLSIGECGLDKACDTPWESQIRFFSFQVKLANELKRPILLHCVKAFEEVMTVLEEQKSKVPYVFHGYSKGYELAKSLQNRGAYLSLGKNIFNREDLEWLTNIDHEKIFFETDTEEINVEEVYLQFSKITGIEISFLKDQVHRNFLNVFGNERHKMAGEN